MNHASTMSAGPQPTRDAQLSEAFLLLVSILVEDFDVVELLDRLVRSCCTLLPTPAAAILLRDANGDLSVVASSGEESFLLELLQLQQSEGPCLDCVRTGTPVITHDLDADLAGAGERDQARLRVLDERVADGRAAAAGAGMAEQREVLAGGEPWKRRASTSRSSHARRSTRSATTTRCTASIPTPAP